MIRCGSRWSMCRTSSCCRSCGRACARSGWAPVRCRSSCTARSMRFAWLVRLKILPSLLPLAPLIHWAVGVLSFGEHRGGMFVAVEGADATGRRVTRSWHMIAEGDDGPLIPSMAAEAVIRHCLAGRAPAAGARGSVTDLELSDYEPLFARRRIVTGFRASLPADAHRLPAGAGRCARYAARAVAGDARRAHRAHRRRHGDGRARQGLAGAACRAGHGLPAGRRECSGHGALSRRARPRALAAHLRRPLVLEHAGGRAAAASSICCANASARSTPAWRWCSRTAA